MKMSAAFQNFSDINMALTGFFLFGAVFIGAIIWMYWVRDDEHIEHMSQLPLKDEV